MRALVNLGLGGLALAACADPSPTNFTDGGEDIPVPAGTTVAWQFDDGMPPDLFNVLGDWSVENGTLRQTGEWPNPDYPRLIALDRTFTDLTLSVRCRLEAGDTDRACGLMFRAVDSENYYITRANALEDNIRLYAVVAGARHQLASHDRRVRGGEWHDYAVEVRGTHIVVTWDGETVIEHDNSTFAAGAVGVWTKADSITTFDDLTAVAH